MFLKNKKNIKILKTYLKKDNINNYVYVLYNPISANEFLNHPILNVVLYNNVGKTEYNRLHDYFKLPHISLKEYEEKYPYRYGMKTAEVQTTYFKKIKAIRVCLKKGNPQVRVDFASVQGRNPKA